jgi:glycosyltransferase involved in cell wall biosynthesis
MAQPLVSVIIPVYKCQAYFHEALESVLTQTYQNLEIVVVDSSNHLDKSLLEPYGDRITYCYQKPSGVAAARNLGIQHARGELIALQDADDVWLPEKLSTQVGALLQFREGGFIFTGKLAFDASGVFTEKYLPALGDWFQAHRLAESDLAYGWLYRELLRSNYITTSSVLMRKDILNKVGLFDETFAIAEDYDLWLRIARDYKLLFVNRVLTKYREHPDGLSGPAEIRHYRWSSASITVREKHLRKSWIPAEYQSLVKQVLAQECWELGLGYFTQNCLKEARAYFRRSLQYRVFDFRVWLYWAASFLPLSVVAVIRWVKRLMVGA